MYQTVPLTVHCTYTGWNGINIQVFWFLFSKKGLRKDLSIKEKNIFATVFSFGFGMHSKIKKSFLSIWIFKVSHNVSTVLKLTILLIHWTVSGSLFRSCPFLFSTFPEFEHFERRASKIWFARRPKQRNASVSLFLCVWALSTKSKKKGKKKKTRRGMYAPCLHIIPTHNEKSVARVIDPIREKGKRADLQIIIRAPGLEGNQAGRYRR